MRRSISFKRHFNYVILVIFTAILGHQALADEVVEKCAKEKFTFDGVQPLKYAEVIGESGSHISFNRRHPSLCKSADDIVCTGRAYLIPGNTVAVANICGDYAQVQFIGERVVSYGWVQSKKLQDLQTQESSNELDGMPSKSSYSPSSEIQRYPFRLVNGRGIPVCEAYLQRLNQTQFPNLPSCGRPENDGVPGFARLNREELTTNEFNRTFNSIEGFISNRLPETREADFKGRHMTWRYKPAVDIDNDGVSDNLLLWSLEERDHPQCGEYYYGNLRRRGGQAAVIMTVDGNQVDKDKTMEVFGRTEEVVTNVGLPVRHINFPDQKRDFWPIGSTVGIFKYRNLYYFDTFYDTEGLGDFNGDRSTNTSSKLNDTLAVLLSQNHQTQEICTYLLMDDKQGK